MAPVPAFVFRSPQEVEPVAAIEDAAPEPQKGPRAPRPILGLEPWEKVGGCSAGDLTTKCRVQQLQAIRARGQKPMSHLVGIGTTPLPLAVSLVERACREFVVSPEVEAVEDVPTSPEPNSRPESRVKEEVMVAPEPEATPEEKLLALKDKLCVGLVQSSQSGELTSAFKERHRVAITALIRKQPVKPSHGKSVDARAPRAAHGLRPWAPIGMSSSEAGSVAYYKDQLLAIKKHGTKNAAKLIGPPGVFDDTVKSPKKPKAPKPEPATDELATSASLPPLKVSTGMKNKQAGIRRTPRAHAPSGVQPDAPMSVSQQINMLRAAGRTYVALKPKSASLAQEQAEQPKAEEPKAEEPNAEEPKAEETLVEEKVEEKPAEEVEVQEKAAEEATSEEKPPETH